MSPGDHDSCRRWSSGWSLGIALAAGAPDAGDRARCSSPNRSAARGSHGLQMMIVPLVVALLVIGVAATAEAARAGRIAGRAIVAFVVILWVNTVLSRAR